MIDPEIDSIVQEWPMFPRRFVLQVKILSLKGQWPLWHPEEKDHEPTSDTQPVSRGPYLRKGCYSKLQWKDIIQQAGREHGRDGKPLPEHKVVAEYGNGKFALDGHWAKSKTQAETERCGGCKTRDTMCRVVVEKDDFYTGGRCTRCLAHKSICSLIPISTKTVRSNAIEE